RAEKIWCATPGRSGTSTRTILATLRSWATPTTTISFSISFSSLTHDDHILLHLFFLPHPRARSVDKGAAHAKGHAVVSREFYCPGLEHHRAQAGHLQHFAVGDVPQPAGFGHDPGVSGVHAVHVGVNLAHVGLEGRREGDRGGVGAAAPEGGDVVVGRDALKAGDDDDPAGRKLPPQTLFADV